MLSMEAAEDLNWHFDNGKDHHANDRGADQHDKPVAALHSEAHLSNPIHAVLLAVLQKRLPCCRARTHFRARHLLITTKSG